MPLPEVKECFEYAEAKAEIMRLTLLVPHVKEPDDIQHEIQRLQGSFMESMDDDEMEAKIGSQIDRQVAAIAGLAGPSEISEASRGPAPKGVLDTPISELRLLQRNDGSTD